MSPVPEEIAGDGIDQDCDGADAEASADVGGKGEGKVSAGCASIPVGNGAVPPMLLGLVALAVRRRRAG